jgi:hypothetical protein
MVCTPNTVADVDTGTGSSRSGTALENPDWMIGIFDPLFSIAFA